MLSNIPLNQTVQGGQGKVTHIEGDQDFKRKLMSLGIRKGQHLSILQQRRNGVVIMSNGSRVAVGESIARQVFLQLQPTTDSDSSDI